MMIEHLGYIACEVAVDLIFVFIIFFHRFVEICIRWKATTPTEKRQFK